MEYNKQIFIKVSESETIPEEITFVRDATVPAGSSTTLEVVYVPLTASAYNVWVLDASNIVIGKNNITFKKQLVATIELDANSGGYAGMGNTLNITLTNDGDSEYNQKVFIKMSESESETLPEESTFVRDVIIPAGSSTTLEVVYAPLTAGVYNVWVLDANNVVIGNNKITFKEVVEEPKLSFTSIRCTNASEDKIYADYQRFNLEMSKVYDTKAEIVFDVKNDGGYYEGEFMISIWKSGKGTNYYQVLRFPAYIQLLYLSP